MKYASAFLLLLCCVTPSLAQQSTDDPEYLKAAITSLQVQRNNALDNQAVAEAKLYQANQQIKDLQAKIKDLQDKSKDTSK